MATKQQKRIKALEALIDEGLSIPEVLRTLALRQSERANKLAEKARNESEDPGALEFDDKPVVSDSDEEDGAFVMCWVWVDPE